MDHSCHVLAGIETRWARIVFCMIPYNFIREGHEQKLNEGTQFVWMHIISYSFVVCNATVIFISTLLFPLFNSF